jgi:hypothetical protein
MAQAGGRVPAGGVTAGATPPLAAFVRAHRVCWEIGPHVEARPGELRRAGVELVLHAQVRAGVDPGAPETQALHERLREIAQRALPRGVQLRLVPFAPELHFRRDTAWRPEVDLVLELDASPARALAHELVRLGVPEGVYAEAA